jgi:hypothetical protein
MYPGDDFGSSNRAASLGGSIPQYLKKRDLPAFSS